MSLEALAIHHWHIVISGFLQNEGQPSGMVRLWRILRTRSSPDTCVELRSWDDDWRQLAEMIYRVGPNQGVLSVKVYAYSWGAGWGAMQLAQRLRERCIPIECMVLSDPVYRSPWLLGRWLALLPLTEITVPDNVRRVVWFRQQVDRPAGHNLAAQDTQRTQIDPPVWADMPHVAMDDLSSFHMQCLRIARNS